MGHLCLAILVIASVFIDGLQAQPSDGLLSVAVNNPLTVTENSVSGITVSVVNAGPSYGQDTLSSEWTVYPALSDPTNDIDRNPDANDEEIEVNSLKAGTFYYMLMTGATVVPIGGGAALPLTPLSVYGVAYVTKPKAPAESDMYVLSNMDDNVCILYASSKDENNYNKVSLQITQTIGSGQDPTAPADPDNDVEKLQEAGIKCISLAGQGFSNSGTNTMITMKLKTFVETSLTGGESVSATKTLDLSEKKFNVTLSYNEGKCIRTSLDDAEDEMWDCKVMMMPEVTGLDKYLVYEYTVNGGGMNEMTGHVYNHDCEDDSVANTRMCEKYISGLKRDIGYTVTFTKIFVYGYMPQSFTLPSDDMYHIAFTAFAFNAQAINMAALLLMSIGCSKLF